jgi:hypothetical protein
MQKVKRTAYGTASTNSNPAPHMNICLFYQIVKYFLENTASQSVLFQLWSTKGIHKICIYNETLLRRF